MIADWMGAGRALGKPDTALWYAQNYDKIKLHPETRTLIDNHFNMVFTDTELERADLQSNVENWPVKTTQEAALHVRRNFSTSF